MVLFLHFRLRLQELRGIGDVLAHVHAVEGDQDSAEERHAPSPLVQRRFRQKRGDEQPRGGPQEQAATDAERLPAAQEGPVVRRSVLRDERQRRAELAARCQALQQAQHRQQDGCQKSHLGIRWQASHEHGADAHAQDRQRQSLDSSVLVGVRADQNTADGAYEKARSEDQEAEQEPDDRVVGNEEICGNDRCEVPVQPVVEPFQHIPKAPREHRPG